ncbi:hypothetical protein WJX73_007870 [Symbiochloris irregularis]|uniref:Fibrous sheath-interacting protein 1 n=1 Tax=Symbiochloris irregularis TaxID=706552 RepID=A0AAW1P8X0_9CHLO
MRKNASAPALASLAAPSASRGAQQNSSSHHPAGPVHALRQKRDGRPAESGLTRVGSHPILSELPQSRPRQVWTRAEAYSSAPPNLLDQADQLVLETFQPQGLFGSTECIEMYGRVISAPDLRELEQQSSEQASQQQGGSAAGTKKSRLGTYIQGNPETGGDERLAECLATPITGDDKNLGEIVDEEARQARARAELRTQLRYAMETRLEQGEEEDVKETAAELDDPTKLETPHQMRQRRRRRPAEDVYAYLQLLGIDVEPSRPKDEPFSPESQAAVEAYFSSSMDDTSNTLHLEDHCPASGEEFVRRMRIAPSPSFRLQQESPSHQSVQI